MSLLKTVNIFPALSEVEKCRFFIGVLAWNTLYQTRYAKGMKPLELDRGRNYQIYYQVIRILVIKQSSYINHPLLSFLLPDDRKSANMTMDTCSSSKSS